MNKQEINEFIEKMEDPDMAQQLINYDGVKDKDKLQICLCDTWEKQDRLANLVHTEHSDFWNLWIRMKEETCWKMQNWIRISLIFELNNCASHSRYFSDELDAPIFL